MRKAGLAAALGLAAAGAAAAREVPAALGGRISGARAERVRRSPQWRDGKFCNRAPRRELPSGTYSGAARELLFDDVPRKPAGPIPLVPYRGPAPRVPGGLHLTWYGHASSMVEIEGSRVLFDPVWSERCSPSTVVGPRRMHAPPHRLEELPELDAIVISHDHYDHLDMATVRALTRLQRAPFVVPLGVGAHLARWRVPRTRIIELDWEESTEVAGVRITATEAQHFSGRAFQRDNTLWASWVLTAKRRKVFYTGDSGYFAGYADIGRRHGPFDLGIVQVGAYGEGWPDIHMTPEEGVAAHLDVRAGLLVPVHWATFNLALHPWTEPADRVWQEAKAHDVTLAMPRPGERIDVDDPPAVDGWWQTLG